ncbi:MAG TPA: hypothetical protein VGJ28_13875, partial [Micromonosporaceae bacterium]
MSAIGRLAAAGDVTALAAELAANPPADLRLSLHADLFPHLPDALGGDLAAALVAIADGTADDASRKRIFEIVKMVGRQTLGVTSPDAAYTLLTLASRHAIWGTGLVMLGRRLDGADIPLTGAMVAVMRRTAGTYQTNDLVSYLKSKVDMPLLNPGEQWSDQALADLEKLDPAWADLVTHACAVTSAKPTPKWEARARDLVAALGGEPVGDVLCGWLRLVGRPRTIRLTGSGWGPDPNDEFDAFNTTALRGLIWTLGLLPADADSARVLGALVETSLRKVPGLGPRSPKIANSAV